MANAIELFKAYIEQLDEVYSTDSLTAALDGNNDLVSAGANAGELVIPKLSMDGLGEYDRTGKGYPTGSVTLNYETKKCNYDRGRRFDVNDMDNQESAGIAFGRLASVFIRTKVIPEIDAVRFATYAKTASDASKTKSETLSGGENWIASITEASTDMDNDEVPTNDRILFLTPTAIKEINNLDTTKSRAFLDDFSAVVKVPQKRFYSEIDLLDGRTSGEEAGGFKKSDGGVSLNYLIVSRSALIQYMKNVVNKVITPQENQEDDAWRFFYHAYGICESYENKTSGFFASTAAA